MFANTDKSTGPAAQPDDRQPFVTSDRPVLFFLQTVPLSQDWNQQHPRTEDGHCRTLTDSVKASVHSDDHSLICTFV